MNMLIWCSDKFLLAIVLMFKTGVLLKILWNSDTFFQDFLIIESS